MFNLIMINYDSIRDELSTWLNSEEGIRAIKEIEDFGNGLAYDLAKGREYKPEMDSWVATC